MISATDLPVQDVFKDIKVERHEMWDDYTGTQEALITAHLASEAMFPVWPKRVKSHFEPNTRREECWRIERRRGAKFQLRRWHEPREEPLTPGEYKEVMEISLGSFLEMVRSGTNDFQLSNANDLEQRMVRLLSDVSAARVIRKPRLAVVK